MKLYKLKDEYIEKSKKIKNKELKMTPIKSGDYGKEIIMDIHNAESSIFTRQNLEIYFEKLCELIDMQRGPLHFWDDLDLPEEFHETEPHLVGTSAIQFIKTSNITIHTLDIMKRVYINLFSCKDFDENIAKEFSEKFFQGECINVKVFRRI